MAIKWQIERRVYENGQAEREPRAWRPVKTIEAPNLAVALVRMREMIKADARRSYKDSGEYRLVRQDHIAVVPWESERSTHTKVRLGVARGVTA